MALVTTGTPPAGVAPRRRVLYIGLSVLMAGMAIIGFWPGYFGALADGTLVKPVLIHVHAAVFTGWLVLFFVQAYFAATKRIHLHLRAGQIGIWYGSLLILVGLTTGVVRSSGRTDGQGEELLLAIVEDMLMFAGFFGVAIWHRKRPRIHRPAMVVAATALLIAAVARMEFLTSAPIRLAVWSMPVLIAMAIDFSRTQRVHPVYLAGLSVFVIRVFSISLIGSSAAWASLAQWVFAIAD